MLRTTTLPTPTDPGASFDDASSNALDYAANHAQPQAPPLPPRDRLGDF
jgi:hypothetical protein